MARVFISHSTRDKSRALELLAWLRAQGHTETFLDSDKDTGIAPGADWERTLYREIERSQAVVILLTKHWMDSKWCFAEFTQARALGKAIFPVVETPAGELMVGSDLQTIDLTREGEGGLERLARALTDIALASPEGFLLPEGVSPFPGLDALSERQAAVFFGRDGDITALIERLRRARTQGGSRLIPIVGASGSGKSSLLQAGLLPRLKRDPQNWLVMDPFRPETDPAGRLIARLLATVRDVAAGNDPQTVGRLPLESWRTVLSSQEPSTALREISESIRQHTGRLDTSILITIDQGETLFALAGDAERNAFLKLLSAALDGRLPYFGMATLRSEYLADLQEAQGLSVGFEPYTLAPIPLERLPDLVRGPARLAGLAVEDALVDALMSDAGSADALPLVAFTLRRLYDVEQVGGRLTLNSYRALGDAARGLSPLENAVRQTAEEALPETARSGEALKHAFIPNLVGVTPDGKFVRRAALVEALPAAARDDIDRLVGARLLVLRTEERAGTEQRVVEVAHESLFHVWDRLAGWIGEERDFLVGKSRIGQAYDDWQALAPEERARNKGLLGDILLERTRQWISERPEAFSGEERTFILASIQHEDDRRARIARLRRWVMGTTVTAAVVFAVASVALGWLWVEAEEAKRQALASLNVARSKTALRDDDVDTAVLSALEGLRADNTVETRSAALTAMLELSPHLVAVHHLPERAALAIGWAGGSKLALLTGKGVQWIEATGPAGEQPPPVPVSPPGPGGDDRSPEAVFLAMGAFGRISVVFDDGSVASVGGGANPDMLPPPEISGFLAATPGSIDIAEQGGKLAIRVGYEGVLIRDCPGLTREHAAACTDSLYPVDQPVALALDPQGTRIAVADADHRIRIHEVGEGFPVLAERDVGADIGSLDWSSGGNRLAVGTRDGQLLVLDAASAGLTTLDAARPTDSIPRVQWSPDGSRLAFVCDRKVICVRSFRLESASPELAADVLRLNGHLGTVTGLAWSPDGTRIASTALDDTLRVWSMAPDRSVRFALETGTGRQLRKLAVDHAGGRIAAGDEQGGIWVWGPDGERTLFPPPAGISAPASGLAWSARGQLAFVYANQAVGYWSLGSEQPLLLGPLSGGGFSRIAALAGGRYAVPLSDGRIAVLSDIPAPPSYLTRPPGPGEPKAIAAHPDGNRLFVSFTDGSIRTWDPAEGGEGRVLVTAEAAGPGAAGAGSLAVSSDGRFIAATRNDDVIVVYDPSTGEPRFRLPVHGIGSNAVAFSESGHRLAVLAADGNFDIWDLDSSQQARFVGVRGVPDRSVAGRAQGWARKATWIQWVAPDRLAVATVAGDVQLYGLDPNLWSERVNKVLGPTKSRHGGTRGD